MWIANQKIEDVIYAAVLSQHFTGMWSEWSVGKSSDKKWFLFSWHWNHIDKTNLFGFYLQRNVESTHLHACYYFRIRSACGGANSAPLSPPSCEHSPCKVMQGSKPQKSSQGWGNEAIHRKLTGCHAMSKKTKEEKPKFPELWQTITAVMWAPCMHPWDTNTLKYHFQSTADMISKAW